MYRNQFKPTISLRLTATAKQKHHRTLYAHFAMRTHASLSEIHVRQFRFVWVCMCIGIAYVNETKRQTKRETRDRGNQTATCAASAHRIVCMRSIHLHICIVSRMCWQSTDVFDAVLLLPMLSRRRRRRTACMRIGAHQHKQTEIQLDSMRSVRVATASVWVCACISIAVVDECRNKEWCAKRRTDCRTRINCVCNSSYICCMVTYTLLIHTTRMHIALHRTTKETRSRMSGAFGQSATVSVRMWFLLFETIALGVRTIHLYCFTLFAFFLRNTSVVVRAPR